MVNVGKYTSPMDGMGAAVEQFLGNIFAYLSQILFLNICSTIVLPKIRGSRVASGQYRQPSINIYWQDWVVASTKFEQIGLK